MGSRTIIKALFRNKRVTISIFLPILFLGIVLSSAPVISVSNVGVIINFMFQHAYPMDAYMLLNFTFGKNVTYSFSEKIPLGRGEAKVYFSGIRFIGNIYKEENKIWSNASERVYGFGEIQLAGIGLYAIKFNRTNISPLVAFFVGPKTSKLLFGKEVEKPVVLIAEEPLTKSIWTISTRNLKVHENATLPENLSSVLNGATFIVQGVPIHIHKAYYPSKSNPLKISYDKLYYLEKFLAEIHAIKGETQLVVGNYTSLAYSITLDYAMIVLPTEIYHKIVSRNDDVVNSNVKYFATSGSLYTSTGKYVPSRLALFIFGVSPKEFINQIYNKTTFKQKLLQKLTSEEQIIESSVKGIPIISFENLSKSFKVPSATSYIGKPILVHSEGFSRETVNYLTEEYASDVIEGNYIVTGVFIFTFPLLLLVSIVVLTTVLENSIERSRNWIRTIRKRGTPYSIVKRAISAYCIILAIVGAILGIIFSGVALPRIIQVLLGIPLTTSPLYYFSNSFLYVFSIPATLIVSFFSLRRPTKDLGKLPLVGRIVRKSEGIRVSRATLVISLISIYGVLIWYFRITPMRVLYLGNVFLADLFIVSIIVSFPFLIISPLLVPRFLSMVSFAPLEKLLDKFSSLARIFTGELGELGFNSSRLNLDRIKVLGYALTLALSTTFGMILIKSALPGAIYKLSLQYSEISVMIYYVFKALEMFLVMISIFSFAIGIVGTYGCIMEMLEEIRPQLIVARARGARPRHIIKMSYGAIFPYLLYASLISVGIGFSLMFCVDAILSFLEGAGATGVPHLVPTFDPFFGMYFAYVILIFLAPYLVIRSFIGKNLSQELRRVWS